MFTGIIEYKGKVSRVDDSGGVLVISAPGLVDVPVGGSVSVSGVCLTVVDHEDEGTRFDVIPETLSRTNLGGLAIGDEVNLELPMPAYGRFDGHIVQGHIDGTGEVVSLVHDGVEVVLTISTSDRLSDEIVEKGSVAIDGVSLTVAGVDGHRFSVALIPHTLELTTLGSLRSGDVVNLETDVIAKYVRRLVQAGR